MRVDKNLEPVKPVAPDHNSFTNVFDYNNAENSYDNNIIPKYQEDSTKYAAMLDNKISGFRTEVTQLLNSKRNIDATDIASAIDRSIYFHQTAPDGCLHYTVLISDGIETKTRSKVSTNQDQPKVIYLLAGGSAHARGEWLKICKPIVTTDLETALAQIGIN
jgi:hypothetical protein